MEVAMTILRKDVIEKSKHGCSQLTIVVGSDLRSY
jgi:hypothetical protein